MKLKLSYIFLFLFISCKTEKQKNLTKKNNNEIIEYYDDDNVRLKSVYDSNNKLITQISYSRNGNKNREVRKFSDSTYILENYHLYGFRKDSCISNIKGNCIDEITRFYSGTDNILEIVKLKKQEYNGKYLKFHVNGNIAKKGNFIYGEKTGEFLYYTENGKILQKEYWKNDSLVSKQYLGNN